jgi:hypothetical protein
MCKKHYCHGGHRRHRKDFQPKAYTHATSNQLKWLWVGAVPFVSERHAEHAMGCLSNQAVTLPGPMLHLASTMSRGAEPETHNLRSVAVLH